MSLNLRASRTTMLNLVFVSNDVLSCPVVVFNSEKIPSYVHVDSS